MQLGLLLTAKMTVEGQCRPVAYAGDFQPQVLNLGKRRPKETVRIIIITAMVVACIALAAYFHFVLQVGILYSHLFYVPVVLSAFWWTRRGIYVAIGLAIALLVTHLTGIGVSGILDECVRAAMLVVTGTVVAELRRRLRTADLRQAAIALSESEEKYRNLFLSSPLAMVKVGDDGSFILVNEQFAALTGYSEADLVGGMGIANIHPEDEAGQIFELHRARREASAPSMYETTVETRDGKRRQVEVNVGLIPGSDEDIAILKDITERKQEEEAVRESEEKYRTLIEAFPYGVGIYQHGKTVFANPGALKIFAVRSIDELLGRDIRELIADRDRDRLSSFKASREKGEPGVPDHYFTIAKRSNGEEFPVELFVRSITYQGQPAHHVISIDVTERRRAEEALKNSEREKQLILDSISALVVFHDRDLGIVWANHAAAEFAGLAPSATTEKRCHELWQGRTEPCKGCPVQKAIETGEPHRLEMTTPDGRIWGVRGYPARDGKGNIIGAVEFAVDITERNLAREALRQADELYRTTIEATTDFVYLRERAGRYVQFNESSLKPLDINRNDVIGKTAGELRMFPLENRMFYEEMHRRVVESGKPIRFEDKLILRHHMKVMDCQLWPVKDKAGNVIYVAGFGRDITQRKRAEEQLRRERDFSNTLIQASPAFFVTIDTEGKTKTMNNSLLNALGYTTKVVAGTDYLSAFVPEEDRAALSEIFDRLVHENEPALTESRVLTRRGRELLVEWHFRPIFNEVGAFEYFFGLGVDITERKQAENALRISEEKYRTLIDNIQDGAFIIQDAKMQFVNDALAAMIGYAVDEVIGMDFRELVAPEDLAMVADNYSRRQKGEKVPPEYEFRILHKDGKSRVFVNMNVGLVTYRDQIASMGTLKDITERKRAEQAVRQSQQ
ncbi:MAG: hypothetical protein A2Y63_06975 [Candidatus Riflebacteria bacterium RBG_13_59_9]|nr:MAG: hypothetical protein A2Y63_06975 [Candidatus Riflebacteria bacterium RBG_13_59_9]